MGEVGIDQGHNLSAQRPILFKAARIEDLEPDLEIGVANENGRILLVTVARAVEEPALVQVRVVNNETRIQALDKISRQTIVDPCAIVLTKEDPGLALRIPDDVLPLSSRAGEEQGPL
ncbi:MULTISPECIES: hypothetical protein [Microvirga]|uniref:hypothetical protein n=1 Tax=Microvirga TaxID=186650 RepID=UPI0021C7C593|nr:MULTISPECIES: hypothetical protein [unclassified Microvirga]